MTDKKPSKGINPVESAIAGVAAGAALGAAAVVLSNKKIRQGLEKGARKFVKTEEKEVKAFEKKAGQVFEKGRKVLIEKLENAKAKLQK